MRLAEIELPSWGDNRVLEGGLSLPAIPAAALLDAWEQGGEASPGERGLLLLCVAYPDRPAAELAGWTVGRRDTALLSLRQRFFGDRLSALANCPACQVTLELDFPIAAIRVPEPADVPDRFDWAGAGYRVIYRLPTAGDLAALGHRLSVSDGAPDPERWLIERCLVRVEGTGASPADLPDEVFPALAAALAGSVTAADPRAEIELALTCPECGREWSAPFDIVGFLWRELDAWAARLLGEVHLLASHYGWSERDILALSPARRQRYLDLIGA